MSTIHPSFVSNKRDCSLCNLPIGEGEKVNWHHHPVMKSKGGTATIEVHKRCHVQHHSSLNQFQEWGRRGGIKTASLGLWIFNLKSRGGPPDPLRWIPFGR